MLVRRIEASDHEAVLALNQGELDSVGALTLDRLREILRCADQAVAVEDGAGALAGFAITLGSGTTYDSINYRWFTTEYDDFIYLDRIVVSPDHRRRGVATMIYNVLEERARPHGLMALEVYIDPPNTTSLAFHGSRGYVEVGRLVQTDGKKTTMMVKQLARV